MSLRSGSLTVMAEVADWVTISFPFPQGCRLHWGKTDGDVQWMLMLIFTGMKYSGDGRTD